MSIRCDRESCAPIVPVVVSCESSVDYGGGMFESAITPPTFRSLSLVLRPARTATAVWPKEWQITATRMMECYLRMWGGVGNILFASTEDSSIDHRFWPLLSAFDPDSYATYLPTRRGQHLANPEGFEEWLDNEAAKFAGTSSMSFDEARAALLEDQMYRSPLSSWSPDESHSALDGALRDQRSRLCRLVFG